MKRSGQHAIIHWICKQNIPIVHLNNCTDNNKRHHNRLIGYKLMEYNKEVKRIGTHLEISQFFNKNKYKDYSLICNFEDKNIDFQTVIEKSNPKNCKIQKLLVLRDPFNLYCSRHSLKFQGLSKKDMWKNHAVSFLNNPDIVPIDFNKWHRDINYRMDLAEQLEFEFTDDGREEMFHEHSDSSFDKFKFKNNASKMEILNRWMYCKDNKKYMNTIDNKMRELSRKIFDFCPF